MFDSMGNDQPKGDYLNPPRKFANVRQQQFFKNAIVLQKTTRQQTQQIGNAKLQHVKRRKSEEDFCRAFGNMTLEQKEKEGISRTLGSKRKPYDKTKISEYISVSAKSIFLIFISCIVFVHYAFAQSADYSPPQNGTIQFYCLKYKDIIGASEENCNKMFDGNNVKTAGGWVFLCNGGKIIADQFPAPVRFGAHFIPCTPDLADRFKQGLNALVKSMGIIK